MSPPRVPGSPSMYALKDRDLSRHFFGTSPEERCDILTSVAKDTQSWLLRLHGNEF